MALPARPAHTAAWHDSPPQLTTGDGAEHWTTRGANYVIDAARVRPGAVLERTEQADEYMLLLPRGMAARVEAGAEAVDSEGDALCILPPGSSRVTARTAGWVYRVFSHRATDVAARAGNAADYANGASDVAPLEPWPEPVGGYRLRHYTLADYVRGDSPMRLFRSTNLMMNVFVPQPRPRDIRKMTPHAHDDFEQSTIMVAGSCVHHLRYPWTSDLQSWREDEHLALGSPSVIVIPPRAIHTTQTTDPSWNWLVDVFAPPRVDFSLRPGLVCNADEYPLPAAVSSMPAATGALA